MGLLVFKHEHICQTLFEFYTTWTPVFLWWKASMWCKIFLNIASPFHHILQMNRLQFFYVDMAIQFRFEVFKHQIFCQPFLDFYETLVMVEAKFEKKLVFNFQYIIFRSYNLHTVLIDINNFVNIHGLVWNGDRS